MKLDKSFEYLSRAKELVPVQSQTFSKNWKYFPFGVSPIYLQRGEGSHVWDVDGNEYIDFICGLGPITLGYNYPRVNDAIIKQLQDGIIFSLPHPLEVELAELLVDVIPCAEQVRFVKTGTLATSTAVRIAKAYTQREKVAYFGYHGGDSDWYGIVTDRPKGIPKGLKDYIFPFEYNNLPSLEEIFCNHPEEIACVIMEPIIFTMPEEGFLEGVRELAHRNGAILIWDETITVPRLALGGAQEYFKITPDLTVIGKGVANGMPLAAVMGSKEIMQTLETKPVFSSGTFYGECLSLAAAMATILEMREKNTIGHCWKMGEKMISGLSNIGLDIVGLPPRFHLILPQETPGSRSLLMQELISRRILTHSVGINLCYSHTEEDVEYALKAYCEAVAVVNDAIQKNRVLDMLKGRLIQPVFRRF